MKIPTIDSATAIIDKRGIQLDGSLRFVDEMKTSVKLSDYLAGDRPIILNLGYFGCPALCGQVVNAMLESLNGMELKVGEDFEIVTVSIDPNEKPPLAREKKNSYLSVYTESGAEDHWHFLTGEEDQIAKLADNVGFGYQWNPFGKQWDHSAGLMILSPNGVLSEVLKGGYFPSRTLRLALVDASAGQIGTAWDRILLTCYGYDETTGEYSLMVWTVIRTGGALTVLGIATMIFVLWRRERRRVAPATT